MLPSKSIAASASPSPSSSSSYQSSQLVESAIPFGTPAEGCWVRFVNRLHNCLRYDFTLYRQIFAFILTVNLAVLVAVIAFSNSTPISTNAASAAAVNLAVGVLFRQEQVINLSFWLCSRVPRSWPLALRKKAARVFHYGGLHSGCGFSAVVWYMLYTGLATREFILSPTGDGLETLITAWMLVVLFLFLVIGAYPKFRTRYHDKFEAIHRFSGWTALAIFWAHVLFIANRAAVTTSTSMGLVLASSVSFWSILIATLPVVTSWSQLRKRSVKAERLSDHATRLHFDYMTLGSCYGIRVSTRPLLEWHSFAAIPNTASRYTVRDVKRSSSHASCSDRGFSLVVSNAGDWTNRIIQEGVAELWVRGSPLRGVIYSARLFHKVVVVATGSGIGPCLSLLVCQQAMLPSRPRVLWSAPSPLHTFGKAIVASVKESDPHAVIWDTKKRGRPDLVHEAEILVRECGAEAVYCVSNPKVCKMLVDGLGDRGIAAYAPIFDS